MYQVTVKYYKTTSINSVCRRITLKAHDGYNKYSH